MSEPFITCYPSGKKMHPLNPHPDEICIEDIAHALSNICRFNGHCREFYSVAQHCWHVASFVPKEFRLLGLLHDAAEAYICDLVQPLKRSGRLDNYIYYENEIMYYIGRKFNLPYAWPDIIQEVDHRMLFIEARDLDINTNDWGWSIDPLPITIKPMLSIEAKQLYLRAFKIFGGKE